MSWNYRVFARHYKNGRSTYHIHEAFYTKSGKLINWTADPVAPCGENIMELQSELRMMIRATALPVIDLKDNGNRIKSKTDDMPLR